VAARLTLDVLVGRLPYASNTTLLARDGGGDLWVYKPVTGEEPLWDFPWRTLAAREVLAYEVSEAMELGIVPCTVEADGPLGEGSAQQFVDEDVDFDPRPMFSRSGLDPRLWPFAVFDIVANNADRKVGHILSESGTGRLWAIDNGLTFHPHPKLRTVLWGFAGQPIPGELMGSLRCLREALARGLRRRVERALSAREAEALVARVEALIAHPVHPPPPTDRPPVPWPMW
jgi:uncharacterized repeat protein (TIGR03843 family)